MMFWARLAPLFGSAVALSAGSFIFNVLMSLGIGYATYSLAIPTFVQMIHNQMGNLPGEIVQVLALAKVDVAITIIFSAVAFRLSSRIALRRLGP